jgi:hypothetical protein
MYVFKSSFHSSKFFILQNSLCCLFRSFLLFFGKSSDMDQFKSLQLHLSGQIQMKRVHWFSMMKKVINLLFSKLFVNFINEFTSWISTIGSCSFFHWLIFRSDRNLFCVLRTVYHVFSWFLKWENLLQSCCEKHQKAEALACVTWSWGFEPTIEFIHTYMYMETTIYRPNPIIRRPLFFGVIPVNTRWVPQSLA